MTASASSMCFFGLNCEENTLRTIPSARALLCPVAAPVPSGLGQAGAGALACSRLMGHAGEG